MVNFRSSLLRVTPAAALTKDASLRAPEKGGFMSSKTVKIARKKNIKYLPILCVLVWIVAISLENASLDDTPFLRRILAIVMDSQDLTNFVDSLELGWANPPADWLADLCPEVVDHYTRFPSFKKVDPEEALRISLIPTERAAQLVCTLKVTKALAASVNARIYLDGTSHLGAKLHGQPMPWSDILYGMMDHGKLDIVQEKCKGDGYQVHPDVTLRCTILDIDNKGMRFWLHHERSVEGPNKVFQPPFLKVAFYKIANGTLNFVMPPGHQPKHWKIHRSFDVDDYFPTIPYYFGGIYVLGPQSKIFKEEELNSCRTANWNAQLGVRSRVASTNMDCEILKKRFPFTKLDTSIDLSLSEEETLVMDRKEDSNDIISNGPYVQALFPSKAYVTKPVVKTSIEERLSWAESSEKDRGNIADMLTEVRNLNNVAFDNTISPYGECKGKNLKVIEFNANNGRWWLEASHLLRDADVIILNGMDIGMARSDNQHTTRLMAYHLGMNYAWGAEFVELTAGSEEDRKDANGVPDFYGLHGNAILTKCEINDPILLRNQVEPLFSGTTAEKRIGSNMAMLGRIIVNGQSVVIGSAHDLDDPYGSEIKQYIGSSDAVIAGSLDGKYCGTVGLKKIISNKGGDVGIWAISGTKDFSSNEGAFTWPASCSSFGEERADNICSNMINTEKEETTKPCVSEFGFDLKISDHALISTTLEVNIAVANEITQQA